MNQAVANQSKQFAHVSPEGLNQLEVLGSRVIIRLRPESTNGQYSIIEQITPPGAGVPLHVHSHENETFHVLEGQVLFNTQKEEFLAKAGESFYFPAGVPHAFKTYGEQPSRLLVIVSPGSLEFMFSELAELPLEELTPKQLSQVCGNYGIHFLPTTS